MGPQDRFFLRDTIAEMIAILTDLDAMQDDGWVTAATFAPRRERSQGGDPDPRIFRPQRSNRRRLNRRKLDLFGELAHR